MAYKLDRRLWLTADGARVVEDGDPAAASLLGSAGRSISDDDAKRYGLKVQTKEQPKSENKSAKKDSK